MNTNTNKQKRDFWEIIRPRSTKGLILRIVLCLLIPEAYLMLCGLVFDRMLHLYSLTTFIFVSYLVIALLCLAVIICSAVNYTKRGKSAPAPRAKAEKVKTKAAAPAAAEKIAEAEAAPAAAQTEAKPEVEDEFDQLDFANLDISELLNSDENK